MKPILGILGPTAVGKSKLALLLAQKLHTEIISADSMQIYKGCDIATAKPTPIERSLVKHHMVDIVPADGEFSSFLFKREAEKILEQFSKNEMIPIIVGGTGFFFKNLIYQFDFEDNANTEGVRQQVLQTLQEYGADTLYDELAKVDPKSAEIIHKNDTKKVMRALEIFHSTGMKKSEGENLQCPRYDYLLCVLNKDRKVLYRDIDSRVDEMVAQGLIEEARTLYNQLPRNAQCLTAIGYKELIPYFEGTEALGNSIELIKQHSRNYAKRQITFYKKMDVIWIDTENMNMDTVAEQIIKLYKNRFTTTEI